MIRSLKCAGAAAVAAALLLSLAAASASAQGWPGRPIRVVAPAVPGGVTDIVARAVSQPLSERLGQPVVVENRAGGSGLIATEAVATAPPDGYTILLVTEGNPLGPNMYRDWKYDTMKSLDYVSLLGSGMFVIVVHPSLPIHTLKEFVAYAKAAKEPVLFGTPGIGQRLVMEQLKSLEKFKADNVAYKGGAQAVGDIVAGHVKVGVLGLAPSLAHFKSGALRPLAVTGARRAAALPDVPTVAELGYKDFEFTQWQGFGVPPGTPPEIVTRLHDELIKVMAMPATIAKLASIGMDNSTSPTPAAFTQWIKQQNDRWPPLFKAAGIQPE
ncbi:MAG: tripartite tricarboxylate transporter substrate binding protein [Proteobacteria bacterium]|nr:tripartite tricarboxylate transporter substrate binding protein [Pseudomonadota bacterium]